MFSIIIPTLNEEDNIYKVVTQFDNYKNKYNLEIIISDSGSSDNTVELSTKIADNVVVYKEKKCNISKARNYGAKFASNNILIFLDADMQVPDIEFFFETLKNQFINSNLIAVSPRITVNPNYENFTHKFVHLIILLISNIMNFIGFGYSRGGCQIINKKYFDLTYGYNEEYVAGEDVDLFRRNRKFTIF